MPLRILIVEDTPERQEVLTRLCKDHAWVLVHTVPRALKLLEAYDFDLIFLDYDLAAGEKGDRVASFIPQSRNAHAKVIVHTQNAPGAKRLQGFLPQADVVPFAKMIRNNATFKRLQEELARGVNLDWPYVWRGKKPEKNLIILAALENQPPR
jgi:CheY-like chemotaxis protein